MDSGIAGRPGRMWLLIALVVVAVLAGALWREHRRADQAERQEALDASRMVAEMFRGKRDLRVGQLSGVVVARSDHEGMVFRSTQVTRAPATVNYLLELGRIGDGDVRWDEEARIMTVRIPDVTVETPAVDMSRAEVRQQGAWISRKAGADLQAKAARTIAVRAAARAQAPENLARARAAAIVGVREMVRQPLAAAGLRPAEIRVAFPWEGRGSTERWDVSRSVEEVLANRN